MGGARAKRKLDLFLEVGHSDFTSTDKASFRIASEVLSISTADQICSRCASINFTEVFASQTRPALGSFVIELDLEKVSCSLCQLFATISPTALNGANLPIGGYPACHVRAFSANQAFARLDPKKHRHLRDETLLGVVLSDYTEMADNKRPSRGEGTSSLEKTGYLGIVRASGGASDFGTRLLNPEIFDVRLATDWMAYCQQNHTKSCKSTGDQIPSLRVIDCETRNIIFAPATCQYVALSYVWGTSARVVGEDLSSASLVIQNSIDLVLQLKLRYLWVDRYCIDQSNDQDKHDQISQMDTIYANAELTIIAAAGNDPVFGLPGVGGKSRNPQPHIRVGEHLIAATLPSPGFSLRGTKWASRAWTYQEGLLSKRRLIFTDHQVIFECNSMHCRESIIQPLDAMHTFDRQRFRVFVPPGAFIANTPGTKLFRNPWEVMGHIAEYSQRQLTYPADRLNGIQGILRVYSKMPQSMNHLVGVPIIPPVTRPVPGLNMEKISRTITQGFAIGMTWYTLRASKRQPGFPSWTWAGWSGELAADFLVNHYVQPAEGENIRIQIELRKGHTVDFPSAEALPAFSSQYGTTIRFILITSPTLACSIVFFDIQNEDSWAPDTDGGYFVQIRAPNSTFFYSKLYLTDPKYSEPKLRPPLSIDDEARLLGILIGNTTGPSYTSDLVLLVEKKGSYTERVGIFILNKAEWYKVHNGHFSRYRSSIQRNLIRDIGARVVTTRLG